MKLSAHAPDIATAQQSSENTDQTIHKNNANDIIPLKTSLCPQLRVYIQLKQKATLQRETQVSNFPITGTHKKGL